MISLKRSNVIQLVAVVKSLLKSQMINGVKNMAPRILALLAELFCNVSYKGSLDFLSHYYFDTKGPVAFTGPLALYRGAKGRYPSLTFHQVGAWLQSRGAYTLHGPVRYNFQGVIVAGIDDWWQADLVCIGSLARFSGGYKFLLACIDVEGTGGEGWDRLIALPRPITLT